MQINTSGEIIRQQKLVDGLLKFFQERYPSGRVRLIETHISWVLLVGRHAYKIKKSVNLDFLNFSSLEARHYYCGEEIRINRRLAADLYLGIIAIGGSYERPLLGATPAIEYAVHMRRFPLSFEMDKLARHQRLLPGQIDRLAELIARFHLGQNAAENNTKFGSAAEILLEAEQSFLQLNALLENTQELPQLVEVENISRQEFERCSYFFGQRKSAGFVRECHGDLHLGNIVLIKGRPVPFDALEFNQEFRWIDVINEVAFTMMDLEYHGLDGLAARFLSAYLEGTGDYAGVRLLCFYKAHRAIVRAKVSAIRVAQPDLSPRQLKQCWKAVHQYLQLAQKILQRRKPALVITCGLPGSGKSTFAQLALERYGALRIRSDVERKRIFGLGALESSMSGTAIDIYNRDASAVTYTRLIELADDLLGSGCRVIVDAAFLKISERKKFMQLAQQHGVPFVIAHISASSEQLRQRVTRRKLEHIDASEADASVVEKLESQQEYLTEEEGKYTVQMENGETGLDCCVAGWNEIQRRLN